MSDIDFLSLQDVLLAHMDQIARYGGDPGVRDVNLLQSAVAQPQATFGAAFLHDFPFEMAAAHRTPLGKSSFSTAMSCRNTTPNSSKEFAMTRTFPKELNQFIQDELQTGGYADEEAVLTAALEVFREVRQRHAELRSRVQESLLQAHAGEATPLDVDELRQSLANRIDLQNLQKRFH